MWQLLAVFSVGHALGGSDFDTVAQRLLDVDLSACPADAKLADSYASTLSADGSWPDVNYTDRTRTGGWSPHVHLDRLMKIAATIRAAENSTLINAAHAAISFWTDQDPKSDNWWWQEIGAAQRIASISLLFKPWLTIQELQAASTSMQRAHWWERTGANLNDEVNVYLRLGVITSNETMLAFFFDRLWGEIKVAPPITSDKYPCTPAGCATDGIQSDQSFHQHSTQLLLGSYGRAYAEDMLVSLQVANGTSWAASSDKVDLFVGLLLDGMRWMRVGNGGQKGWRWDWSVVGRSLGGQHSDGFSSFMTELPSARRAELLDFQREQQGLPAVQPLSGTRAYWTNDYMMHKSISKWTQEPWSASIHMHSHRTVGAACVNGQGAFNEHSGDGLTYLYYNGTEFNDIFNYWDWQLLPGITAVQEPGGVASCNYSAQLQADSAQMNFTGGVTDGISGMASMELVSHDMFVRKSVTMMPQALLSIVSDVASSSEHRVVTTVDVRNADGPVHILQRGSMQPTVVEASSEPQQLGPSVQWVHHAQTGYILLDTATPSRPNATLRFGERSRESGGASKALFELTLSGGTTASWLTLPGVRLEDMAQAAKEATVALRQRVAGAASHVVVDLDLRQAFVAFWRPGTAKLPGLGGDGGDLAVTVSRACLAQLTFETDGSVIARAADPTNDVAGGAVDLHVGGVGLAALKLPAGWDAGRTSGAVRCNQVV